jgi:hypothetical protein
MWMLSEAGNVCVSVCSPMHVVTILPSPDDCIPQISSEYLPPSVLGHYWSVELMMSNELSVTHVYTLANCHWTH